MFLRPGGTKIVGNAADGDHQSVVTDAPFRNQYVALFVFNGGQYHFFLLAIEVAHSSQLKMKTVAAAVGQIVQFVNAGIQRTGGDFMQQGFPQVSGVGVNQFDLRFTAATQFTAQAGSEFEPACATADNYDAMHSCSVGK